MPNYFCQALTKKKYLKKNVTSTDIPEKDMFCIDGLVYAVLLKTWWILPSSGAYLQLVLFVTWPTFSFRFRQSKKNKVWSVLSWLTSISWVSKPYSSYNFSKFSDTANTVEHFQIHRRCYVAQGDQYVHGTKCSSRGLRPVDDAAVLSCVVLREACRAGKVSSVERRVRFL